MGECCSKKPVERPSRLPRIPCLEHRAALHRSNRQKKGVFADRRNTAENDEATANKLMRINGATSIQPSPILKFKSLGKAIVKKKSVTYSVPEALYSPQTEASSYAVAYRPPSQDLIRFVRGSCINRTVPQS